MKATLYGEVADRVLSLIESGTFRAGDKLPSIRSLSDQFEVSVNTVKEAYGLLESQRFLEARPQSGYYVRRSVPPLPRPSEPAPKPSQARSTVMRLTASCWASTRVEGSLVPGARAPEVMALRYQSSIWR